MSAMSTQRSRSIPISMPSSSLPGSTPARASPTNACASSTDPYAVGAAASFGTRPPSPRRVYTFIPPLLHGSYRDKRRVEEDAMAVIVAGARTPIGRLQGSLKGFSATDLGGVAITGALRKAGVAPERVQYVIMGQVLQAGAGQIPARQAAVKAGVP